MTLETIRSKHDKDIGLVNDFSAEKTIETIKKIAENIRMYSILTRETTRTIRKSGVIPELAGAIREAVSAVRDSTIDIRETARELKQNGTIDETIRAVEETKRAAQETVSTVSHSGNKR